MRLNAKQLRITPPTPEQLAAIVRKPIYLILDNVLDTYNIGSIFRLADAVAARKVFLCAGSETPPNTRIHKSAIGTEEWVAWEYCSSAGEAIYKLKNSNPTLKVVAVEQDARSIALSDFAIKISDESPMAIVVGHETDGVSAEVLSEADFIVEIPMYGVNTSLNVHVSAAIVVYSLLSVK